MFSLFQRRKKSAAKSARLVTPDILITTDADAQRESLEAFINLDAANSTYATIAERLTFIAYHFDKKNQLFSLTLTVSAASEYLFFRKPFGHITSKKSEAIGQKNIHIAQISVGSIRRVLENIIEIAYWDNKIPSTNRHDSIELINLFVAIFKALKIKSIHTPIDRSVSSSDLSVESTAYPASIPPEVMSDNSVAGNNDHGSASTSTIPSSTYTMPRTITLFSDKSACGVIKADKSESWTDESSDDLSITPVSTSQSPELPETSATSKSSHYP